SGLMHRISAERAAAVYSGLLQNLNVPQGTSGDVLFVDAPTALGIIERFLNAGWWLRPLNEIKGAVPQQWDHCLFVYRAFEATVRDVLNEESGRYTEELRILEDLI